MLIQEIRWSALSSLFLLKDEKVTALLQSKYSLVSWLSFQTFRLCERMVGLCICLHVLIIQEVLPRQIFLSNSDFLCTLPIVIRLREILIWVPKEIQKNCKPKISTPESSKLVSTILKNRISGQTNKYGKTVKTASVKRNYTSETWGFFLKS